MARVTTIAIAAVILGMTLDSQGQAPGQNEQKGTSPYGQRREGFFPVFSGLKGRFLKPKAAGLGRW